MKPSAAVRERFMGKVRVGKDCWEWLGAINNHGYGTFSVARRTHSAHKFSYEMYVGAVPHGLDLDHLCRNRWCVNPAHLEPVTRRENTLRGEHPAAVSYVTKTCGRGHSITGDNVRVIRRHGRQYESCLRCSRERLKRYRRNKRKKT